MVVQNLGEDIGHWKKKKTDPGIKMVRIQDCGMLTIQHEMRPNLHTSIPKTDMDSSRRDEKPKAFHIICIMIILEKIGERIEDLY